MKVIYPGTFDPFTAGRRDLVRRAARLFDSVLVGIADSESSVIFLDQRADCDGVRGAAAVSNVEVLSFSGLLMDFVHAQGAQAILRGRRRFDFEPNSRWPG